MIPFYVAVEGVTDEAVARRIMGYIGCEVSSLITSRGGKTELKKRLKSYNHAAKIFPWFVLTDLDGITRCPVAILNEWLPGKEPGMCFRIAVCQMESWLIASRESLSRYLQISKDIIPLSPEEIEYPKSELVRLASRSRSREIVRDMVRDNNKVGIAYPSRIIEFATKYWDIDEARRNSKSLDRCIMALERIKNQY